VRIALSACLLLLLAGLTLGQTASAKPIEFTVNGSTVAAGTTPPQVVSGKLYIPVRLAYEALGAKLGWEDERKTLVITVPGHEVKFPTGERGMLVDGDELDMGELPKVIEGSMYIEEGVFQRSLPVDVRFDREARTVEVTYQWEKRKVTLEEVLGWPRFFVAKELIVEGDYRGWQAKGLEGPVREGPPPSPSSPRHADGRRGDWILKEGSLALYVTKKRLKGLHPLDDVGARLRVEAVGAVWEKTVAGAKPGDPPTVLVLPYLKASKVERL
jgi:hypothetical protein